MKISVVIKNGPIAVLRVRPNRAKNTVGRCGDRLFIQRNAPCAGWWRGARPLRKRKEDTESVHRMLTKGEDPVLYSAVISIVTIWLLSFVGIT